MKINTHVSASQLATFQSGSFQLSTTSLCNFGIMPIFELPSSLSVVVEFMPRDGIRGLLFTNMFRPNQEIQVFRGNDEDGMPSRWLRLYRWSWSLGWTINAVCMKMNRCTESFTVVYTVDVGGTTRSYSYDVMLTYHIEAPERLYTFLVKRQDGELLRTLFNQVAAEVIDHRIRSTRNPGFMLHIKPEGYSCQQLCEIGCEVDNLRIQFVN